MASTGTHTKPTPRSIAWCLLALLPSRVSLLFGNPDFWMRLA